MKPSKTLNVNSLSRKGNKSKRLEKAASKINRQNNINNYEMVMEVQANQDTQ